MEPSTNGACRRVLESTWSTMGLKPRTISARLYEFDRIGGVNATGEDVRRFLLTFANPATRRTKLSSLRACYHMLIKLGMLEFDPTVVVPRIKAPAWMPKPLADDEVEELLHRSTDELHEWFVLALYAGLRAQEIALLQAEQLERGRFGWQLRVVGKGDREAVIPAHPRVVEVFRAHRPQGRLYPGGTGNMVTQKARYWMHEWGMTGGIHRLRHNFGTRALEASGESLLVVRDLMRHASVSTTQIYAKLGDERMFETVRKIA